MDLILKVAISALVIAAASEIARRSTVVGALIASHAAMSFVMQRPAAVRIRQ
jgi:hypothetical protein